MEHVTAGRLIGLNYTQQCIDIKAILRRSSTHFKEAGIQFQIPEVYSTCVPLVGLDTGIIFSDGTGDCYAGVGDCFFEWFFLKRRHKLSYTKDTASAHLVYIALNNQGMQRFVSNGGDVADIVTHELGHRHSAAHVFYEGKTQTGGYYNGFPTIGKFPPYDFMGTGISTATKRFSSENIRRMREYINHFSRSEYDPQLQKKLRVNSVLQTITVPMESCKKN